MKRHWIFGGAFFLLMGCDGVLGIESAEPIPPPPPEPPPECTKDSDCAQSSQCMKARCEDGTCRQEAVDYGVPIQEQTAGDCKVQVCDGLGGTTSKIDPDDIADDANPCTLDQCVSSIMQHIPQADVNIPCYEGPPGTEGVGICHGGVLECDAIGTPIGCKGQVLPQAEVCQTSIDENCNGLSTLSEGCSCGDGIVSGNEQCDDGNASNADDCSATCQVQRVEQLVAGQEHACARLSGGIVKCWGRDTFGERGVDDTTAFIGDGVPSVEMGQMLERIDFGAGKTAVHISAGGANTCAVLSDGSVKCWGYNARGQLGNGQIGINWLNSPRTLAPVNLQGEAIEVSAAMEHTCALLKNGAVKCWGYNVEGALGLADNDYTDHPTPMKSIDFGSDTVKGLSSGIGYHSCVLLEGGGVKCWGFNGSGQLGRGNTTHYGRYSGEMGDNQSPVPLGGRAIAISVGTAHSCALLDDHTVKCWGDNQFGQLGQDHKLNIGDEPGEMESLQAIALPVPFGVHVTAISASGNHTCALISEGTIMCWGSNKTYGLGQRYKVSFGDAIGDSSGEMAWVKAVNLGPGEKATAVRVGGGFSCAVLEKGNIKCWGQNQCGKLGLDKPVAFPTDIIGDASNEMGDNLPTTHLFSDVW